MTRTASILLAAGGILAALDSVFASPKVVGIPFKREVRRDVQPLRRRAQPVEVTIGNGLILYAINVTVGTPPQSFTLQLDSGSADTWIPSVGSDFCTESRRGCQLGAFDSSSSSTFVDLAQNAFQIQYVDDSQIQGDYFADTLDLGGDTSIQNLTMGLANRATRGLGIMGIGYSAGESIVAVDPTAVYPNIIDQLRNQGFINTRAYSLYLNDLNADSGNILFGGIDTNKYTGDLIGLPVQPDANSGGFTSFTVAFTALSVMDASGNSQLTRDNIAIPAILDSGTTNTYLPDDLANAVLQGVGVTTSEIFGNVVSCQLANESATFVFEFGGKGGATINVSLSQFVSPLVTSDGSQPTFDDGTEACSFGIDGAGENPVLFGDTFLRSAYVVHDLDNNQIALAQARFDVPDAKIVEITKGDAIPGVVSIASEAQVTQTLSGPFQTQPATMTATESRVEGTQRTATFNLTPATASARLDSNSASRGAAATLRSPPIDRTTILAGAIALASFMFGGGLALFL
jgi:Eukaryotic aspartyl protease